MSGRIKLGVDLGFTVVTKDKTPFEDSFRVLRRFKEEWKNVVVVSRVNPEQKIRSQIWLKANDFHAQTGIPFEDIFYCAERCDKAEIAFSQGITHFIDDRPDVMTHMAPEIIKLLFRPIPLDLEKFQDKLVNCQIVQNWKEIEKLWL